MKLRKLLVLTGIVFVLLALVIIKNSFQKKQDVLERVEKRETVLVNSNMDVFASKVVIYKGDDEKNKIILSKQEDGQWVQENRFGLKVKKDTVDSILNILKDLKGELRADSKSAFDDFKLQDNQAVHLILFGADDKLLTHLLVSTKSLDYGQNFIRVFDSNKIMLLDWNILAALGFLDKMAKLDESYFADYKIFSFNVDSVKKIELMAGEKRLLALTKALPSDKIPASIWNFEPANKKSLPYLAKVNEYLQNVVDFSALDILDANLNSYGFNRPTKILKLSLIKDNKPEQIQIEVGYFIKDKQAYYVRVVPQNQVFIVSESFINNLNQDKSYFTAKADKAKKK